jgi:hypothetical protein
MDHFWHCSCNKADSSVYFIGALIHAVEDWNELQTGNKRQDYLLVDELDLFLEFADFVHHVLRYLHRMRCHYTMFMCACSLCFS